MATNIFHALRLAFGLAFFAFWGRYTESPRVGSLDAEGGTALTDYTTSKGYLDCTANSKTLGPGVGFWVNEP